MRHTATYIVNQRLHNFCWFIFILLQATSIKGQNQSTPLYFDHLTINERLSHNTVYCMLQDRHGYIWIGTQNGLNKYDGYSFEVYRSKAGETSKAGFLGKNISSLFEDRDANLWVGTRKHGINLKSASSDRFINLQNDPAFSQIHGYDISAINEDKKGTIWICTVGAGLLSYDPQTKTSRLFTANNSNLSNNLTFDIVEDKLGTIWVVAAGLGVNYLKDDGYFTLLYPFEPDQPDMSGYRKKICLDGDYLWVGTEGTGLYRVHINSKYTEHFTSISKSNQIASNVVRDVHKTQDGQLFIATDGGGLYVYNEDNDDLRTYTYKAGEKTALNSNAILSLLEDRTGNIWIGTFNGGINISKAHKTWFDFFEPINSNETGLDHRSVLSIYQSKNGDIWVGTDGGGLNQFDQETNRFILPYFKNYPNNGDNLSGDVIKTIFEDSQNNLWIGLFGSGLDKYNPTTKTFSHFQNQQGNPQSLAGNNVWSIGERKDGTIWVGTIGGGLSIYNPQNQSFTNKLPIEGDLGSLSDFNVMVVFIDREDQVWIGTGDMGLEKWDDNLGVFSHYKNNQDDSLSISHDEIRAIYQDSNNNIWIGTEGGGLNRWLGDGQFERINKEDGLIANSVMGITEDKNGMIWISTFEGISRLNPQTKAIQNYDFHSQPNSNQFNQMAILTAANDQLFFGGIHGLNAIKLEQLKENATQPSLIFTNFNIFNKSILAGDKVEDRIILELPIEQTEKVKLSYLDNSFSIEFAATDFTNPQHNKFSYMMEGFDNDWQQTLPGQHVVNYTNLDPGVFTFKVRHKEAEAQLIIEIEPPFWQTIWFKIVATLSILGLGILGIVFLIIRREASLKRQMLEADKEILKLKNEKLASEVDAKNSKLMYSAIQMAHKNEILTNVKEEVQAFEQQNDSRLRKLLRMLDQQLKSEDYWKEFNLYFNEVDQDFTKALLTKHPSLTQNDLRICALVRINLTTKEIASLLNISVRGVEQSRYRLKKRLGLKSEDNLAKYISSFQGDINR